jgi:uncharacterized membrane protein YeaQ/YmgE (transglycosylase-associated protein family)
MNLMIWLMVGGLVGWIASVVMITDARQGGLPHIVAGIVGAFLGAWLISPLVGGATINQGDLGVVGLLVSVGGAILLLGMMSLVRRSTAR